jgi:hypothetical protein
MNTLYQLNHVLIHLMQLVILTQKTHFSKGEVLMNCNVQNELYNGKKHKINNKLNNYLLNVENNITQLLNYCICIYIICDTFLYDRM